jgi:putative peptidoglycan lipid II flippase
MTPAVIGLAATQINILVDTSCASRLLPGSVSYLNYAIRLVYLPLGVFGVSIATVTLPTISHLVARQETGQIKTAFSRSLRLVLFLTIPATVALIILRIPLISLLFQHGTFDRQDTIATSGALVFYVIGLFAYSSVRVLAATFYSLGESRLLVKAGFIAMAVNVVGDLSLMGPFGYQGIAFATSISGITNMSILLYQFKKRLGNLKEARIFYFLGRVIISCVGMAIVTGMLLAFLNRYFPWTDFRFRLLQVIMGIFAGGATFITITLLLKIEEIRYIYRLFRERFSLRKKTGEG